MVRRTEQETKMFTEYDQYDATGLAALVAEGEVTPAELVETAWARIAAGEPKLNAISQDTREKAASQIAAGLTGPFAGVPFLLKDLDMDYAGTKLTMGSLAAKNYVPTHNNELVNRYLKSGLVVIGTTNAPELGLKATTETTLHGDTRNPWNTGRTPGGSSGGSGAAVAAGYVPMAAAADGGGSIRIPAAFNGLFGLKPSRGRVPLGPDAAELWDGCVCSNVVSRTVRDSAAMLDALQGPDEGDPFIIAPPERPYAREVGARVETLRIGFSTTSPIGGRVDPAQKIAVENAAKLLESLGHHVEEASPAVDGKALASAYMTMYFGHVAATVARVRKLTGSPESDFDTDTRAIALLGRALSAEAFVTAHHGWNDFARAIGKFHQSYDIYLTPTTAMGAAKIGELITPESQRRLAKLLITLNAGKLLLKSGIIDKLAFENLERTPFTQLANMTFCPAMSVPLHWTPEMMPVGVHFSAKFGAEGLLFRLAAQLEQAAPWAQRRPVME
jgi:amidase